MPKKQAATTETPAPVFVPDAYDLHILRLLQQNARMPVKEIAEKINLSATPVHDRIRRLEATGIIKQYTAVVDAGKLNKSLLAICYVSLKEHGKQAGSRFVKAVQDMAEVSECFSISGEFDFMLKVLATDMQHYYDFHVNRLGQVENVGNVQSVFVMGVVKQTYEVL